jgi:5-methylcytosine-specific restriction endonuclease McrA
MARRVRKSKKKRSTSHRTPPRPSSWDAPRGTCRYCGSDIIENGVQNNRKRWCSTHCINEWKLINQFAEARKAVFLRDKGRCQADGCDFVGLTLRSFDVDHIKILAESDGNIDYWKLPNLQLLCKPCHKEKTVQDMIKFRASKDLNT